MPDMQCMIFQKLFFGRSLLEMQGLAKEFMENEFEKLLYMPAVSCLKKAQELGHYTAILSSSPSFLVEVFAKRFNVDSCSGTHYELDKKNCFWKIQHIMQGSDKAAYMAKLTERFGVPSNRTIAYSDSFLDIEFLNAAGTAVGVNPDKKLRRECVNRQWQIIV